MLVTANLVQRNNQVMLVAANLASLRVRGFTLRVGIILLQCDNDAMQQYALK